MPGATDKGNSTTTPAASSDKASGPPTDRFKVKLSHPNERRRTVFSSVSEARARRFVTNRFPRGEEAYLEAPDGTAESYQHERTGPYGEDADQWAPFDPDSYQPPEEAAPPGESAWSDQEA
jgi:hypothetical protein